MNTLWKTAALSFVIVAITGCATRPHTESVHSPDRVGCEDVSDIDCRIEVISRYLATHGFHPVQSDLLGDKPNLRRLEFPHARRVVLVAIGSSPLDNLDLWVTDPNNAPVAADTTPDSRAVLSFVADQGIAYLVTLRGKTPTEGIRFLTFEAPLTTTSIALNGFFDIDPVRRTDWLSIEKRMSRDGYRPHFPPRKFTAKRGDKERTTFQLDAQQCYMFAAAGSPGTDRIIARLETNDRLLVADLARRPEAWVRYCPTNRINVRFELSVEAGSGDVTWGVFVSPRKTQARIVGPPIRFPVYRPTLAQQHDSMDRAAESLGYSAESPMLHVVSAAGSRFDATYSLTTGECAIHYVLTNLPPSSYDMEISTTGGAVPTYNKTLAAKHVIGMCAQRGSEYKLSLITFEENKTVQVFQRRLPPHLSVNIGDYPTALPIREAVSQLERLAFSPMSNPTRARTTGDPKEFVSTPKPAPNRCYGCAVASSTSLESIRITRADGKTLNTWVGAQSPAILTFCTDTDQIHEIRVRTQNTTADAPWVMLFESKHPSDLSAHSRDTTLQGK